MTDDQQFNQSINQSILISLKRAVLPETPAVWIFASVVCGKIQEFGRGFPFFLPERSVKSRFAAEPAFKGDRLHRQFFIVLRQMQFSLLDPVIVDQVAEIRVKGIVYYLREVGPVGI